MTGADLDRLTISSKGYVGIGTAALYPLHVTSSTAKYILSGINTSGTGVYGEGFPGIYGFGKFDEVNGSSGVGVYGATIDDGINPSGDTGVYGNGSTYGTGVGAQAGKGTALEAVSSRGDGLIAVSNAVFDGYTTIYAYEGPSADGVISYSSQVSASMAKEV